MKEAIKEYSIKVDLLQAIINCLEDMPAKAVRNILNGIEATIGEQNKAHFEAEEVKE